MPSLIKRTIIHYQIVALLVQLVHYQCQFLTQQAQILVILQSRLKQIIKMFQISRCYQIPLVQFLCTFLLRYQPIFLVLIVRQSLIMVKYPLDALMMFLRQVLLKICWPRLLGHTLLRRLITNASDGHRVTFPYNPPNI